MSPDHKELVRRLKQGSKLPLDNQSLKMNLLGSTHLLNKLCTLTIPLRLCKCLQGKVVELEIQLDNSNLVGMHSKLLQLNSLGNSNQPSMTLRVTQAQLDCNKSLLCIVCIEKVEMHLHSLGSTRYRKQ